MSTRQLPIPSHFDPNRVGEVWQVPYQVRAGAAAAWAEKHEIRPASADEVQVGLVIVDCQNTFCIPGFELFVGGRSGRGAVEDNVRLCEFIYRNLEAITRITATLDTHTSMQIFHPTFWLDERGEHPTGGATIITPEEVESGAWRVNPAVAMSVAGGDHDYLSRHVLHYVRALSESGKYPLLIWPYHAMLGGVGHALVSAVEEALFFFGHARKSQPRFEIKGNNPLTENYSALRPEVLTGPDRKVIAAKNQSLIDALLELDVLIVAGQAQSHCVAWTVSDLLSEISDRDPRLAQKVYLLEDCTSPVVVPGVIDFTDPANQAFQRFSEAGMHIVRSADPLESWPGIDLG